MHPALLAIAAALAGPHAEQVAAFGGMRRAQVGLPRVALPPVTPGPDHTVYGYLAWWDDDLGSVPWDDLTHIALFSAGATSSGSLTDTWPWDQAATAVAMAEPYGVRVHLCVTQFDGPSLSTLLSSASHRNGLIDELVGWVDATGAHGVNIDFEGLPLDVRDEMVAFTADLDAAVDDVVLATPAVDWAGSWDYSELTRHADLFIMGYGYHWTGSTQAGPNDPLYSGAGTPFTSKYSLSWTLDDYATYGADPARTILGLPLYGQAWTTNSEAVPASAIGSGWSVFYRDAAADAAAFGRREEPETVSTWLYDGSDQTWYGDADTLRERVVYARDVAGVAGIGFWALHYDAEDPAIWSMLREELNDGDGTPPATEPPTSGGTTNTGGSSEPLVADAGAPFLAYVGDTVVLSGAASTGPAPLTYAWTQTKGPSVALSDATAVAPRFEVVEPGNLAFELVVSSNGAESEPATSHVVVVDKGAGSRFGKGCATVPMGGWPAVCAAFVLGSRRVRGARPRPARADSTR
jgi:hypothetical protein